MPFIKPFLFIAKIVILEISFIIFPTPLSPYLSIISSNRLNFNWQFVSQKTLASGYRKSAALFRGFSSRPSAGIPLQLFIEM